MPAGNHGEARSRALDTDQQTFEAAAPDRRRTAAGVVGARLRLLGLRFEQLAGYDDLVRRLWVHRDIDAPAESVWALLTNLDSWPMWGPTVRRAEFDDSHFETGATGVVTTTLGVRLPFEITGYDDGRFWAWKIAGVPATDHTVRALGPERSRIGFGVPWPAAPYLAVCRVALRRLGSMALLDRVAS